eukprot:944653-Prymnesium_polylepis.1
MRRDGPGNPDPGRSTWGTSPAEPELTRSRRPRSQPLSIERPPRKERPQKVEREDVSRPSSRGEKGSGSER